HEPISEESIDTTVADAVEKLATQPRWAATRLPGATGLLSTSETGISESPAKAPEPAVALAWVVLTSKSGLSMRQASNKSLALCGVSALPGVRNAYSIGEADGILPD